jgi:hypothetical protein
MQLGLPEVLNGSQYQGVASVFFVIYFLCSLAWYRVINIFDKVDPSFNNDFSPEKFNFLRPFHLAECGLSSHLFTKLNVV